MLKSKNTPCFVGWAKRFLAVLHRCIQGGHGQKRPLPTLRFLIIPKFCLTQHSKQDSEKNTYKQVLDCLLSNPVRSTAIESAIALTCASITTAFMEKDADRVYPLMLASIALAINFLLRTIKINDDHPNYENLKKLFEIFRGLSFSIIDLMNRSVILHESAHLLAYDGFYKNADPTMSITFPGGKTFPNFDGEPVLSETGALVGDQMASGLTSAAGSLIQLFFSYLSLIAAQALPDKHSEIKSYLRFTSIMSLMNPLMYAITNSDPSVCSDLSQDFCNVNDKLGISPAMAASLILGSMIMLQTFLSCTTKIKKDCQKSKNASPELEEVLTQDQAEEKVTRNSINNTR